MQPHAAICSRLQVLEAELEAIESTAKERERDLRIAETLESFRDGFQASADTLDVIERQKVLRSLVKEVLVGDREITIRQSIPMTEGNASSHARSASTPSEKDPGPQSYLLRWRRPQGPSVPRWAILAACGYACWCEC